MRTLMVLSGAAVLLFALQCAGTPAPENTLKAPVPGDTLTLAQLMRVMERHGDSTRMALAEGRELPPFPEVVGRMRSARPTPGMHIDSMSFPIFAKDYENKLQALYDAPVEERGMAYNALVQSCANCHGSHCPGPLMKIRKMYLTP